MTRRLTTTLGAAAAVLLLTAACGSSGADTPKTGAGESRTTAGPSDAPATEAGATGATLETDLAGTSGQAPQEPVETEDGMNVWVISCAQLAEGCAVPGAAAQEAGEKLGWDVTVFDGAFGAGGAYTTGIRQALSAQADAIILIAVDCNLVQGPLREAQTANVAVIGVFSFDCDDPMIGGEPLFAGKVLMTTELPGIADWAKGWGEAKGRWIVDATDGQAKVVNTVFDGKILGTYLNDGLMSVLDDCEGCSVVEDVHVADTDIGSGVLRQKFAAALTAHPEANATHAVYDAWMSVAGLAQAVNESGRAASIAAMGGEGLTPNMEFIKNGRGQSAAVAYDASWVGYGAIDTVARVLAGQEPLPQGIGWQTVDTEHNVPDGDKGYQSEYDFRADYLAAWGVQ
ncbi:sugar ABC transporter substrate-binding protein [Georgenia sp. AZ-5]|uniref:sugar ABC transporter substrate-binding protein n=1 Tax=Georgenia sp. AZ-5 TaxID=3367526 RepID=UPI0037542437